jgi:hypothetical protein
MMQSVSTLDQAPVSRGRLEEPVERVAPSWRIIFRTRRPDVMQREALPSLTYRLTGE